MPRIPARIGVATGLGVLVGLLATPAPARADLVRLSSGRLLSVDSCVFDGDTVIIRFRNGGEVRAARSLVVELLPDEVPYAHAAALEALASSRAARGPQLADAAIRALVDRAAAQFGVPRRLANAVVLVESNYQPQVVSSKGAMGLMQIMPAVAEQYGVDDPFDPVQNLEAGMQYLRSLLDRFVDRRVALAAYNAGEGAVSRYGGVPPYRETQEYVRRVLALLQP
jgi:soluble lytic murein transglycosylase-like protein